MLSLRLSQNHFKTAKKVRKVLEAPESLENFWIWVIQIRIKYTADIGTILLLGKIYTTKLEKVCVFSRTFSVSCVSPILLLVADMAYMKGKRNQSVDQICPSQSEHRTLQHELVGPVCTLPMWAILTTSIRAVPYLHDMDGTLLEFWQKLFYDDANSDASVVLKNRFFTTDKLL